MDTIVAVLGVLILVVVVVIAFDRRLDALEEDARRHQCTHVLYEDGSTVHQDAEAAYACLYGQSR